MIPLKRRFGFLRDYLTAGKYILDFDSINRRKQFDFIKRNRLPAAKTQDCYLRCKRKATDWHHIIPIIKGGDDSDRNLVPLCNGCHKRVHRRSLIRPNRKDAPFLSPFVSPTVTVVYVPPGNVKNLS